MIVERKVVGWGIFFLLTLLFAIGMGLTLGSSSVSAVDVWTALIHPSKVDPATKAIIWQLRFPRVLVAALVGGSLAIAGVVYQSLLHNPLADPYILGVSSGSAVGAVTAILSGWGVSFLYDWQVPLFAFCGAIIALSCVLLLTFSKLQVQSLLLSGVVVNAFFAAILTFLISISGTELPRIQYWLMGSFTLRDWDHVSVVAPFCLLGGLITWLFRWELNIFSLSTESAVYLGVAVSRVRLILLLTASLITSVAVSISGMIGFVGLVIPHLLRLLLRSSDHRYIVPYSVLVGAIFLVVSDTLSRVLFEPREIPIGVITAALGAPAFAFLLRKISQVKTN
jgi:iron complex transport system permease protein